MARLLTCVALICAPLAAEAQFGRRNKMQGEASGIADATPPPSDVDIAMAGWEQLSRNPDKMQEVMQGMKVGAAPAPAAATGGERGRERKPHLPPPARRTPR